MRFLVFSGTSEGKEIAEYLNSRCIDTTVCVATELGREVMEKLPYVQVIAKRLVKLEMEMLMLDFDYVIDATHPYATAVTENIVMACNGIGKPYIRLVREDTFSRDALFDKLCTIVTVSSISEAAKYLSENLEGQIFVATGSKELHEYSIIPDYKNRIIARVLPVDASIQKCKELGLEHAIYEMGPFSTRQNLEVFSRENAKWLVTKSGGRAGGFDEKIEAARQLGMNIVIIKRPEESQKGLNLDEVKARIDEILKEN